MSRFYKKTPYNAETLNQMWMSMIGDGHDIFCGCTRPFAHLLDSIFPEGHTDRTNTIKDIIERDQQEWLSGGIDEEDHGIQLGESAATEREEKPDIKDEEDLDTLLAAAAAAAENTR